MNFVQLKYFCKAAELEHISKAAEELNITQPTLTATIRKLEEEFGVALFQRQGRNIILTECGRSFYAKARPIADQVQELYQTMSDYADSGQKSVEILTPPNVITMDIIKQIENWDPGISLLLRQTIDKDAVQRFFHGDIDFFITSQTIERRSITGIPLEEDPLVIISPAAYGLGERETISLRELQNYAFAAYPVNDLLRRHFDHLCLQAGFQPKVIFEANSAMDLLMAAESRPCLVYVPKRMVPNNLGQSLRMYRIEEETEPKKLFIYWLTGKHRSRIAAVLRDIIIDYYQNRN